MCLVLLICTLNILSSVLYVLMVNGMYVVLIIMSSLGTLCVGCSGCVDRDACDVGFESARVTRTRLRLIRLNGKQQQHT